jgi:hypothetical protein
MMPGKTSKPGAEKTVHDDRRATGWRCFPDVKMIASSARQRCLAGCTAKCNRVYALGEKDESG